MGITTTLALIFQGYDVQLISSVFPEQCCIFNGRKDHMASQTAAGLIVPAKPIKGETVDSKRMNEESLELIRKLYSESEYSREKY